MDNSNFSVKFCNQFRAALAFGALIWTLVLAASFYWGYREDLKVAELFAREEALASFNKDMVYRRWNAVQGGVYVRVTESTPPNPYLDVPDRDLETVQGVKLTMVNPAYMTRQAHELGKTQYGVKGHITSLKPIRPGNEPDEWERAALESFEKGAEEYSGLYFIGGVEHYRLMRPMRTEKSCLKCHARQGYREGEIRGGVSVSVPMDVYRVSMKRDIRIKFFAHLGIWVIGLALFAVIDRFLSLRTMEMAQAAGALAKSEEKYRLLTEHSPDGIFIAQDGLIVYANQSMASLLGTNDPGDIVGLRFPEEVVYPVDHEAAGKMSGKPTGAVAAPVGQSYISRSGTTVNVEVAAAAVDYGGRPAVQFIARDVSERLRAEKENALLQTHVAQSQKVESIGRLAGGVAHDFNNMLGVIMGHAEMALSTEEIDPQIKEDILAIKGAAEKSASITRQLLAFARKQTATPKTLDLNQTVDITLKMIRRLIGEDIDLLWKPARDLRKILIDPSQIDQILANLATNARDAIGGVGKVVIETSNAELDAAYCADHTECKPGTFVALSFSDNGCGIPKEEQKLIFEPFYTTKPPGEGTGLGLSTVFGIVKQNGGFINVYSEPGEGTTFRLYFPITKKGPEEEEKAGEIANPTGDETILLVEDEKANLKLGIKMLESLGYKVIPAQSPAEALSVLNTHQGAIHLLMTDVIMPGMNGRDLARRVSGKRPEIRVLFMSGYTADVIAHRGVLDQGVNFLQKPFKLSEVARKVRGSLDGPHGPRET